MLLAGPLAAVATRRAMAKREPTRNEAYWSTLRGLSIVGVLTLAVDLMGSRIGVHAFLELPPLIPGLIWTALALAACTAVSSGILQIRKSRKLPPSRIALLLVPRSGSDYRDLFLV